MVRVNWRLNLLCRLNRLHSQFYQLTLMIESDDNEVIG